jgi:hypothetical protein
MNVTPTGAREIDMQTRRRVFPEKKLSSCCTHDQRGVRYHPECEMRSISEHITQGITRGRLMQAAVPEAQLFPFTVMLLLTRMSSTLFGLCSLLR